MKSSKAAKNETQVLDTEIKISHTLLSNDTVS